MLGARDDGQEMIAGQQTRLAAELRAPVGNQDFRFAHAARIQKNLAGQRISRRVLRRHADRQVAERHPRGFAAPAHVQEVLLERQQLRNAAHVSGAFCGLQPRLESVRAGGDE